MAGINGIHGSSGHAVAPRRRVASGFMVPTEAADAPAEAEQPVPVFAAAVGGLLGLQEQAAATSSPAVMDREARRHGHGLLATLGELQRLLTRPGEPGSRRLLTERLTGMVAAIPPAADPALREIVAAIALRSRIELARCRP
jgi:hypothetical protein